jgi:3-methyladenine DNA glycosylase AlkD
MKISEARSLGQQIYDLIAAGEITKAYAQISPALSARTPFRLLDVIGEQIGAAPSKSVNIFLDHIAAQKTMGGWVVIASALKEQIGRDLPGAFTRCRKYIIAADVWYATDILGERVPGPALVMDFEKALAILSPWRVDENRWIRRTVGVAVHFWAKRSQSAAELSGQAKKLFSLLEPMFEERDMDALKGIGWGLKTLGKHYPKLAAPWLEKQTARPHRALMERKAKMYLPKKKRAVKGK